MREGGPRRRWWSEEEERKYQEFHRLCQKERGYCAEHHDDSAEKEATDG